MADTLRKVRRNGAGKLWRQNRGLTRHAENAAQVADLEYLYAFPWPHGIFLPGPPIRGRTHDFWAVAEPFLCSAEGQKNSCLFFASLHFLYKTGVDYWLKLAANNSH